MLLVLVLCSWGGDLLHPVLRQSIAGEDRSQGTASRAGVEHSIGDIQGVAQVWMVGQSLSGWE
ncbi:hypothetical protein PV343_03410 [Streptomyces sp. WI03-4A]|uniref:hypothetical protein n=1 Tax=Streptomyces sp. WI03-4A TaxID=3028706 RepID=UPI0029B6EDF3|nr:hypothetical protein [Streptomyces sp. WI03-4A]MDX2591347.1 hypothetical protein [Streptomyces sp. WI03-4A]